MQKRLTAMFLAPVCALGLMAGCVKQNDYDALQRRVYDQDQQLRQMQPAQADTWAQMQSMRQELNTLKGQMDDLQNAGGARALVDKVNRHDAALRQVETSLALDLHLNDPTSGAVAPGTPMTPGVTPPSTGMTPPGAVPGGTMVIAPQQEAAPATAPRPAPAPQKDMATALYDAGLAAFNARKYQEAQRSFADFTKNYSNHKLISNAWYYVGESNFQRNQFADAALAYDTVITKYGKSSRAPAAYLKQGIAFSKLGQNAAARARMQELIKKFPNSAEAARAKTFLRDNK